MGVRTIEIKENVFADNISTANSIREQLTNQGTFFINVMSSPGSGKTTTLCALINALKKDLRIGEMDVDIESDLDASRVATATGVRSLQINNGGLCHIDADMTSRALIDFDTKDIDLLILENIGNLVCPAEFDTGAHKNMMILSIPEGDDKPLKYPLMFTVSDIVIFNKIDTLPYFDFNMDLAKEHILKLNPNAKFFPVSAKTGEGIEELANYLKEQVNEIRALRHN